MHCGFLKHETHPMKSATKNYGPFKVKTKEIRVKLKFGPATLTCETQEGVTPMGRNYKTKRSWWIKLDSSPCASGPISAESIRKYYANPKTA